MNYKHGLTKIRGINARNEYIISNKLKEYDIQKIIILH